jgi:hypothetical protein
MHGSTITALHVEIPLRCVMPFRLTFGIALYLPGHRLPGHVKVFGWNISGQRWCNWNPSNEKCLRETAISPSAAAYVEPRRRAAPTSKLIQRRAAVTSHVCTHRWHSQLAQAPGVGSVLREVENSPLKFDFGRVLKNTRVKFSFLL